MLKQLVDLVGPDETISVKVSMATDGTVTMSIVGDLAGDGASDTKALRDALKRPLVIRAPKEEFDGKSLSDLAERLAAERGTVRSALESASRAHADAMRGAVAKSTARGKSAASTAATKPAPDVGEAAEDSTAPANLFDGFGS